MEQDRDEIIAERAQSNLDEYMEHGPGLRHSTKTWILGKDTEAGMTYLGGLGSMGVGEMWSETRDSHREDPTFADAPELVYLGEPFGHGGPRSNPWEVFAEVEVGFDNTQIKLTNAPLDFDHINVMIQRGAGSLIINGSDRVIVNLRHVRYVRVTPRP